MKSNNANFLSVPRPLSGYASSTIVVSSLMEFFFDRLLSVHMKRSSAAEKRTDQQGFEYKLIDLVPHELKQGPYGQRCVLMMTK